jgi:hypothetical protein
MKSGRPRRGCFLRHPVIEEARKMAINRSSVALFPAPRMLDIKAERLTGL